MSRFHYLGCGVLTLLAACATDQGSATPTVTEVRAPEAMEPGEGQQDSPAAEAPTDKSQPTAAVTGLAPDDGHADDTQTDDTQIDDAQTGDGESGVSPERAAANAAIAEVNQLRAATGAQPLVYDPDLTAVARRHVADMADREVVTTEDAEGRGLDGRLSAADAPRAYSASLVAGGYTTITAALKAWQDNPAQITRLLDPKFDQIGFAVIEDRQSRYGFYIEAIVASSD